MSDVRWSRIEDEVPPGGVAVIIYADGWIDRAIYSEASGTFWSSHPMEVYGEGGRPVVTHWMPLPEAPV